MRKQLIERDLGQRGVDARRVRPSTSPIVVVQSSLPASTIMPASVAVIALVSDPRWKRSSTVTFSLRPSALTPVAPAGDDAPDLPTAATSAGRPYLSRSGSRSEARSAAGAALAAAAGARAARRA